MKGIVFTEYLEMVESAFGADVVDRLIDASAQPNDGAYAATGTYDHTELVRMVVALSGLMRTPVPALVRAYGVHLFGRLAAGFPQFFKGSPTAFDFLAGVDGYVHVEVRKLYPDAELPRFECQPVSDHELRMVYRSSRHFADLAEGLLQGCFDHYQEPVTIGRADVPPDVAGKLGPAVAFTLTRLAA